MKWKWRTDPRARPLLLSPEEMARRAENFQRIALPDAALGYVQSWDDKQVRFGRHDAADKTTRQMSVAFAVLCVLVAGLSYWVEADPDTVTRPEGGGYIAAAVFIACSILSLWALARATPNRIPTARGIVDFAKQTVVWRNGREEPWSSLIFRLEKYSVQGGWPDSSTGLPFPIETHWDLTCSPKEGSRVGHMLLLVPMAHIDAVKGISQKLLDAGVEEVQVEAPRDAMGRCDSVPFVFGEGFNVLR